MNRRVLVFLFMIMLLHEEYAAAHPLAPSLLRFRIVSENVIEVTFRTPSVRPRGEELIPVLPDHCEPRRSPERELSEDRSAVIQTWQIDCGAQGLTEVRVRGLSSATTNVVVEVVFPDQGVVRGLLHGGRDRFPVPDSQEGQQSSVVADYLGLGIEHLLSGPDHVLFVLGLMMIIGRKSRLIAALTAFTVGHSISLCLAVLGFLDVPQGPIEIAIAASLLVLALDILKRHTQKRPGPVARWPWAICSAFGLLHGLGFAGALAHTGLPPQAVAISLVSFNVGIELGQLLIVLISIVFGLLLGKILSKTPKKTLFSVHIPAYTLGSLSAFWILERTLGLLSSPIF